jgi:hypothetical protein
MAVDRQARYWVTHHDAILLRNREQGKTRRAFVDSLKASGCVDCGNMNLTVLHLDHTRDKVAGLGYMTRYASFKTLEQEAAKCEVRCSNCHMIKTAERRRVQ